MGKQQNYDITFTIKTEDFRDLLRVLRYKMNEFVSHGIDNDPHEQSLFEHNYWILKAWIKIDDRDREVHARKPYKITLDIMYAKAFVEYWMPVELPLNEANILRKVIGFLDKGLINIDHKLKTKQI